MTEITNQENTAAQTEAAPEVKMTRREKLIAKYYKSKERYDALIVEMKELTAEINNIDDLSNVGIGTAVVITTGKGDTRKEVDGMVIAVKEEEDGTKLYKISFGEGFDADVAVRKAGTFTVKAGGQAD